MASVFGKSSNIANWFSVYRISLVKSQPVFHSNHRMEWLKATGHFWSPGLPFPNSCLMRVKGISCVGGFWAFTYQTISNKRPPQLAHPSNSNSQNRELTRAPLEFGEIWRTNSRTPSISPARRRRENFGVFRPV